MSDLSIFIDESGDFGPCEHHSPYYIVALVFHDQSKPIDEPLAALRRHIEEAGFPCSHAVHTAPLIRREGDYANLDIAERRRLFRALFTFMRQCDISYEPFLFRKREFASRDHLVSRISRDLGAFIRSRLAFFQSFDRVIVYYDNGQKEITNIINVVFNVFLDAEVRNGVTPSKYSLFQAADMVCTLRMLSEKLQGKSLSRSEVAFFLNMRNLKKNYLKVLLKKRIDGNTMDARP